jgi:hypothetical protein
MLHAPRTTGYTPNVIPIPARLDVVAFRDDDMGASVYLAMRVNADSLHAGADISRSNYYTTRTAWFDASWERTGASADSIWTPELPARRIAGLNVFDVVRRARVTFDSYHFACAVQPVGGRARALARADASAARFVGDGLVLSDILLTADAGAPGASIRRGDQVLWPRIDHDFETGQTLRTYLEVYNLSRVGRVTRYDVRYVIYPRQDDDTPAWRRWGRSLAEVMGIVRGDPMIAQTVQRTGDSHDTSETIGIDIGRLAPGRYELVVEVIDAHSGAQASTRTPFVREAEPIADRNP